MDAVGTKPKPELPKLRRVFDVTAVEVERNNIDAAIRKLKRRVMDAGTLRELAFRKQNPSAGDRRRAKARRAAARNERAELLKARRYPK